MTGMLVSTHTGVGRVTRPVILLDWHSINSRTPWLC